MGERQPRAPAKRAEAPIVLGTGEVVERDPLAPTTTVISPSTKFVATRTRIVSRFLPAVGRSPAATALWKRRHGAKERCRKSRIMTIPVPCMTWTCKPTPRKPPKKRNTMP